MSIERSDRPRVGVFGATGMLGHQVCRRLSRRMTVAGWGHKGSQRLGGLPDDVPRLAGEVDVTDVASVRDALERAAPDVVVNAAGIVKQRLDDKARIAAVEVNALFPHRLAELCAERSVRLIHISTDCVFSGLRGRYAESDLPDPPDFYGRSKLLGEPAGKRCLTIRTSIVGWEPRGGTSLLEWFASQRGGHVKGYTRAVFTGLSSGVTADLIGELIDRRPELEGLYHVASEPINKHDLLSRLASALGWTDVAIDPDDGFACDRSLEGRRFEAATGWRAPSWDEMISGLAREWPDYARTREGAR